MSISVNTTVPVIAAQGVAPDLVLQPGTVVNAQVLKILADDLVRIAISSLSIDVFSEVPLQAGQVLQLAVSQTPDGIKLAIVGPNPGAVGVDTVTLAPDAPVNAANAPANIAPVGNVLTPAESAAVATVTQTAATQQASLAPLFANLGAVAASNGLPPQLQQAVLQVLAQRTPLDQSLDGNDIKSAFQKSGLFLEAVLASGSASSTSGLPDLKAALIVLRQTLTTSLGATGSAAQSAANAGSPPQAAAGTPGATPPASPAPAAASPNAEADSALAPSLSPEGTLREILLPQARVPVAVDLTEFFSAGRIVLTAASPDVELRTATAGAALNLLQEALQEGSPRESLGWSQAMPGGGQFDDVIVRTNIPPPPFRGALPSAQPVAPATISSGAPLATTAHQLLGDTDAAIARQTLLQVASLPDRADATSVRLDQSAPRWNFEIPFAMPQGTAMAQFEISRDGGVEVDAAKRVWRARFSIDVEPAGPVHALISLSGERTSVRMWAERPATADQLRAGVMQLGQALARAELQPGDIVIRNGVPPQPGLAPAGHFLDRAL
jgi:hypothetical protein